MSQREKHFYEFGEFRIDLARRVLMRDGETVPLAPKVFDLLLTLAEHSGETIEKDELMEKVWPDTAVEENNLTQNVYTLRKVFGESRKDNRFIATVPGVGYRFVAEVKHVPYEDEEVTIRNRTEARVLISETLDDDDLDSQADSNLRDSAAKVPPPGVTGKRRISYRKVGGLVALVALVTVVGTYTIVRYRRPPRAIEAFKELASNQITRTGTTFGAAISPDGKQVAYSVSEVGRNSLWLRQVATSSAHQIIAPEEASYSSLIFSRDGDYLYFVRRRQGENANALYRMPALGGIPLRLASGLQQGISISPDGRQLSFIRESETESFLMVANADGSDERQLAVRPLTDFFKVPAWSPDGKIIACSTGGGEAYDNQNSVIGIRVEDGKEERLTTQKWSWTRWVEWLADGSGLLLTARETPLKPMQIWFVSYPDGETRKITNDSKDYFSLSLTADSKLGAVIKTELLSEIWVASASDGSDAKRITFGNGNYQEACFATDGRIIYSSLESGNMNIWRMNADGTQKQQLTSQDSMDAHQTVSPDGRYIVFASNRGGTFNIWRMDSDGGNLVRLTDGKGEKFPKCSADGKSVIYSSIASDEKFYSLWKVPIEGGEPVLLAAEQTYTAAVSPNGKYIAYFARSPRYEYHPSIIVIPAGGGPPERTLDFPPDVSPLPLVQWTADSKSLLYASVIRGIANVWMRPLDGTPAKQVTDFKFEGSLSFNLSTDGKRMVFVRRQWVPDLYLLSSPG